MSVIQRTFFLVAVSTFMTWTSVANAQVQVSGLSKDLAIREVFLPDPEFSGDDEGWNYAALQGDIGRDGYADFFMVGGLWPDPNSGRLSKHFFSFSESPNSENLLKRTDPWGPFEWMSGYRETTAIMLAGPSGLRHMVGGSGLSGTAGFIGVWDPNTMLLIREIGAPPPPPGYPKLYNFDQLRNAGDVNLDGYDDLYFNGLAGGNQWWVSGILDGRSGKALWQHFSEDSNRASTTIEVNDSGPPPDFDQDGIPDQLSVSMDRSRNSRIVALSGVDGHELWVRTDGYQGIYQNHRPGNANHDVTGDGVPDVLSVFYLGPDYGKVQCLDGTNGLVAWETPWSQLEAESRFRFGPDFVLAVDTPAWVTRSTSNPSQLEFRITVLSRNYKTNQDIRRVCSLDASTGEFLGFIDIPATLRPWSDDKSRDQQHGAWAENVYPLGDIDNDGFSEIGISVILPSFSQANLSYGFAVLGQPTLTVPLTLIPGRSAEGSLYIPTAAGFDFKVLVSDKFDPMAGLTLSKWKTHLAPSPLLTASRATPVTGRLDAFGKAKFNIPIPSSLVSSGSQLYYRAILRDPAKPNEVFTLSSLGQSKVE
jgi:hypothetical protein